MEEEIKEIDYRKEYEILTYQLNETKEELGKYKQALLNVCIKL